MIAFALPKPLCSTIPQRAIHCYCLDQRTVLPGRFINAPGRLRPGRCFGMTQIENSLYEVQVQSDSSVLLVEHLLHLLDEGFYDRLLRELSAVRAE